MKRKIKFLYDGSWTQWFDCNNDLPDLNGVKIEACIIQEKLTKDEYEIYMRDFK